MAETTLQSTAQQAAMPAQRTVLNLITQYAKLTTKKRDLMASRREFVIGYFSGFQQKETNSPYDDAWDDPSIQAYHGDFSSNMGGFHKKIKKMNRDKLEASRELLQTLAVMAVGKTLPKEIEELIMGYIRGGRFGFKAKAVGGVSDSNTDSSEDDWM